MGQYSRKAQRTLRGGESRLSASLEFTNKFYYKLKFKDTYVDTNSFSLV